MVSYSFSLIFVWILLLVGRNSVSALLGKAGILKDPNFVRHSFSLAYIETPIPVELSSTDKVMDIAAKVSLVIPDNGVEVLNGAENLGALLWAFVLYNGLFTTSGRPADWILPFVAKAMGQDDQEWYQDYTDGYSFICPPIAELPRFSFFLAIGWFANLAWIQILDGDSFWGWSTGACLSIPALLLALSRPRLLTRAEAMLEAKMVQDFNDFASRRLTRKGGAKCSERTILIGFRRTFLSYRSEEEVPDKVITKLIRSWVGYKPDYEGDYLNLAVSTPKAEATQALAESMRLAADMRRQLEVKRQQDLSLDRVDLTNVKSIASISDDSRGDHMPDIPTVDEGLSTPGKNSFDDFVRK